MSDGLYVVLISVHGLIRAADPELGRDADTGGQVLYVLELARALARHPEVARVDLLTRQVIDPKVSDDYARPEEEIGPGARLVRLPCGPKRYLRKEVLWHHLDVFVDNALQHVRRVGRTPDIVHSHYADAGYVGSRIAQLLGVPLIHTGHSLGRVKRERLKAGGMRVAAIESQYNMSQRIEAEEIALGNAVMVVASTRQEVDEQYSQYENYHPKRMRVIPPGVDLKRFRPPQRTDPRPRIAGEIERFLREPGKPMVLALSRADTRKNIATLVRAFGELPALHNAANLVVIAGNRDDIDALDKGAREVLTELLMLIDFYDLYGRIAYPKHHDSADVPDIYRVAARSGGVFVNPALTEPFGLTLLEAAASGLPIVATEDGGPRDIVSHCRNGALIDPLDEQAMAAAVYEAVSDRRRWKRWSRNGLAGVEQHYSWEAHVRKYMEEVRRIISGQRRPPTVGGAPSRLPTLSRIVICDVDDTLIGDPEAAKALLARLNDAAVKVGFGIATGRSLPAALDVLKSHQLPVPDLLITSVGTEIHYGNAMQPDHAWREHIDYRWHPRALREALRELPGLKLQPKSEQGSFKLSFYVDTEKWPGMRATRRHLRKLDLHAKLVYAHEAFFDVLPVRASKGLAIRYLAMRWGIHPESILVAGDSGNDEEMLSGNTLGVVVGGHSPELDKLRGRHRTYFAEAPHAWGVLEGIEHYGFLNASSFAGEDDIA
jgi:sucrose-phosphate synthase